MAPPTDTPRPEDASKLQEDIKKQTERIVALSASREVPERNWLTTWVCEKADTEARKYRAQEIETKCNAAVKMTESLIEDRRRHEAFQLDCLKLASADKQRQDELAEKKRQEERQDKIDREALAEKKRQEGLAEQRRKEALTEKIRQEERQDKRRQEDRQERIRKEELQEKRRQQDIEEQKRKDEVEFKKLQYERDYRIHREEDNISVRASDYLRRFRKARPRLIHELNYECAAFIVDELMASRDGQGLITVKQWEAIKTQRTDKDIIRCLLDHIDNQGECAVNVLVLALESDVIEKRDLARLLRYPTHQRDRQQDEEL